MASTATHLPPRGALALGADVAAALGVGVLLTVAGGVNRRVAHGWADGPWRGWPPPGPYGPDELAGPQLGPSWPLAVGIVVVMGGIVMRRIRPRIGLGLVLAGGIGYLAAYGPLPVLLVPVAVAGYAAAARCPPRRWLPLAAIVVPLGLASSWRSAWLGLTTPEPYSAVLILAMALAAATLLAMVHAGRRQAIADRRAEELRRAAADERLRIAREVHDIVGHSLSVISLQAGVALRVLPRDPGQAETSLRAIRSSSTTALAELRHALGAVRGDEEAALAPAPQLADLDGLAEALSAAGRTVRIAREPPDLGALPPSVELAAFRIAQESLTNVVRHTDRAGATVTLRREPDALVVDVLDDGPALARPLVDGGGLSGMRQRALRLGGSLHVDRQAAGGVRVTARLPLPPPTDQPSADR